MPAWAMRYRTAFVGSMRKPITGSAFPLSSLAVASVFCIVWVSFGAMSLFALSFPNITALAVNGVGHGFKVVGVNAATDTAEMVKFKTGRDSPDVQFVRYDVSRSGFVIESESSIVWIVTLTKWSHPNPATGFGHHLDVSHETLKYGTLISSHVIPPRIASVRPARCVNIVAGHLYFTTSGVPA